VGRILHAGGQQRWLSWVVVPEDTLLYVVARDITSEREAALGLAEANARLREQINERELIEAALQQMQRLEAVGQLTAGVAHDFNNLLQVMAGYVDVLQMGIEGNAQGPVMAQSLDRIRGA
ncbi:hypothetical protein SB778_36500, partial [Paraburkholderia sp. SIMBA_050]